MLKKIKFLRVIEKVWLFVGILSAAFFIYNSFTEKAWTSDHYFLLGVTVVAFFMYTFRRKMRKKLEQQYKEENP